MNLNFAGEMNKMSLSFSEGVKELYKVKKPISLAWRLSVQLTGIDPKIEKIISLIEEHENLFVTRHKYHNQYHLAEVIWASAWLGYKEFKDVLSESNYQNHIVALLLASNFHDVEHPGRGSKYAYEVEQKAAKFFQQWWRNNSLFLENLFKINANEIEKVIEEMILKTDLLEGIQVVNNEYQNNPHLEKHGYKVNKLKKLLNEADTLMNILPQHAFEKISLWVDEAGHKKNDVEKWQIIIMMLDGLGKNYSSDAAKKFNLVSLFDEFSKDINNHILKRNINTKEFQNFLNDKFGI